MERRIVLQFLSLDLHENILSLCNYQLGHTYTQSVLMTEVITNENCISWLIYSFSTILVKFSFLMAMKFMDYIVYIMLSLTLEYTYEMTDVFL